MSESINEEWKIKLTSAVKKIEVSQIPTLQGQLSSSEECFD